MLYSYAPGMAQPLDGTVEWDMHTVLPAGLQMLRDKGWDPTREPLIGTQQAYGYNPRTGKAGGPLASPGYRAIPTQAQLTSQITAFCNTGAVSILGYAWNDGSTYKDSQGTVGQPLAQIAELFNSPSLQAGMKQGISNCRTQHWSSH